MAAKKKPQPGPYKMKIVTPMVSNPLPDEEAAAQWIKLKQLNPANKQPRSYFAPEKMVQLEASIKEKGILEPLVVRPKEGGGYEIVAGERRYKAATALELDEVPCVVRNFSDDEAFEAAIMENLQRDDLNPVEETQAILGLLCRKLEQEREVVLNHFNSIAVASRKKIEPNFDEWETIKALFDVIGRFTPNSFRTNRLPLLDLPEDIYTAISKGDIAYSTGRLISRVEDETERKALLEEADEKKLTRREIQQRIRALNTKDDGASEVSKAIDRMGTIYRRAKKSPIWNDSAKRKELRQHLDAIEKLLGD
ncbi:hypothetical protein N836_00320 [Leptolyngbya sp. Heron Island J]|uniref:ParB/RepB/Spo0J family partition protein n=1 Tax=Leptolyngbya sp. Heron Island J TaxID=1385935 RepID=UPI0003B9E8F6|nr:ParB/RepB/Spo0J family partition protein [Leptolyngbya sp. Heron Island J]ESA37157.1 hypothetical protein N836_00320 [Leptolyngbya sp. Heron Island J]